MTQDLRRSPLAHRSPIADGVGRISLAERPFVGLLVLRGEAESISSAVASVTGVEIPTTAGTFAETDTSAALWLSPDEWLIVVQPGEEGETLTQLHAALKGTHAQVVDVTDYYTAISISGTAARDVLAKATTIDLHPRKFAKGSGVASTFGHAGAWLRMVDDENGDGAAFALYVRRSMADYLWCLFADGGREFGLEPQTPIGKVKLHLPHFE